MSGVKTDSPNSRKKSGPGKVILVTVYLFLIELLL